MNAHFVVYTHFHPLRLVYWSCYKWLELLRPNIVYDHCSSHDKVLSVKGTMPVAMYTQQHNGCLGLSKLVSIVIVPVPHAGFTHSWRSQLRDIF